MARLHIYPHSEPQQDAVMVADVKALKLLANAMLKVAQTPQGYQRVKLHTSDGHEYTIMIVADVSQHEWQTVAPAYVGAKVPNLTALNDYQQMRNELSAINSMNQ